MTPDELRAIRERYSVTVAPMVPVLAHGRADIFALLDEVERISMLHAAAIKTLDAALAAAERLQRERDELRARLVIEQSK